MNSRTPESGCSAMIPPVSVPTAPGVRGWSTRCGLAGVLFALATPASGAAQCTDRELSVGVSVRVCEGAGGDYAVASVDLAAGDVALRGSRSSERGRTARAWGQEVEGAVLVVQAGPFAFPSFTPTGLTVGGAEHWSETADDGRHAVLGFDARGVGVYVPAPLAVPSEPWQDTVVSGVPVARDGVALTPCEGDGCEATARTGLGLTADGRRLIAVVAQRMTDPELGAALVDAGARDGLRSGSGATSVLWASGDEFIVPSSDGSARAGAAHLAVVDRASGAEFRLRGVVTVAGDPDSPLPDATLSVETLGGSVVDTGMPITDLGYWEFTLPVREYIVRASRPGYRTSCKICVGVPAEDVWCSLFLEPGEGAESCAPPPRTLDVGPYPEAPEEPDAGADAGVSRPPIDDGCAAAGGGRDAGWLLALVLVLGRRRRR